MYGVPKMHAHAHKVACQLLFGMWFLPGVGMSDGEGVERLWSLVNALALRTREMTAGHWHEVLCHYYNDLNIRKVLQMPKELRRKYTNACEQYLSAKESLIHLEDSIKTTASLGEDSLKKWREIETEWKEKVVNHENHKTLVNPYEPTGVKPLTQSQALAELKERPALSNLNGECLLGAIQRGIKLQADRHRLLTEYEHGDTNLAWEQRADDYLGEKLRWDEEFDRHVLPVVVEAKAEAGLDSQPHSGRQSRPEISEALGEVNGREGPTQSEHKAHKKSKKSATVVLQEIAEQVVSLEIFTGISALKRAVGSPSRSML